MSLNRARQHWHTRRYGTGSGSDRAPAERALRRAPGRYRSRYRTAACANVVWPDLELLQGLIALRSGVTPTGLIVRDSARQHAGTDPNFCHTVFRIAHNLTKGDGIPVAGYTCSQGQESFFIAYRNQRP